MSSPTLTERQQKTLAFLQEYLQAQGLPPTLREIADALGFSSHSSAQACVESLVRKGVLERSPQHRGLRLPAGNAALLRGAANDLPLIGRVAAGSPILAEENIESQLEVDPALFRPRADYLLRVVGMSMRDAGILDGDLLAVHKTATANDGQIVVARLDDEVTVKRLKHERDRLLLLPENPDFSPIEVDPRRHAFAIEGRYVGIIRRT
ncbi:MULTISPECIES: transcriptional repressor LexA [unclassified Luteibacter]|uniref:transcriptional repressor LexA n=1 Tax=unclassified Luteibacter TaxID=2620188 RepID=UPI0008CB9742|nr:MULTISPECIES: transcriptional repressor LexA [unclassified Luteibacter]SEO75421.1 repressor LexA [Luteibacter sp. UNC138MFCol5.1]SEV95905.1 SOS-response transcriptional repressor, LexA [Luteibacter sp. 329MFSha]